MNKKIVVPLALSLIALASVSLFFESQKVGSFAVPVTASVYAVVSFIVLAGIALFVIFKK